MHYFLYYANQCVTVNQSVTVKQTDINKNKNPKRVSLYSISKLDDLNSNTNLIQTIHYILN